MKQTVIRALFAAVVAIGLLGVLIGYIGWQVAHFYGEETLPTQTCPDGSWSVTISGRRTVFGAIEVTCQRRDSSGEVYPTSVVDVVRSWDELHSKYARIDFEGDMAIVGGQAFTLRPGVNEWPAHAFD